MIIKKTKRSQSSLEFIILIGAMLFFFLLFAFAIQLNIADKTKEKRALILKDTASIVQDEINLAYASSDGYSRQFSLPLTIISKNYTIQIIGNFVYAKTGDNKQSISLTVQNVTGQPSPGQNAIRKTDGKVYLNS